MNKLDCLRIPKGGQTLMLNEVERQREGKKGEAFTERGKYGITR